jgi:hypothetical protein
MSKGALFRPCADAMFALSALSASAFVLQRPTPSACVQHVAASATPSSLVMSQDARGTDRRTALGLAGAAAASAPAIHACAQHAMLPRRCPACAAFRSRRRRS